jgi:hypothetical protein
VVAPETVVMTITDYLLSGGLLALVLFQIRGRRLSVRTLLFPVAVVGYVAFAYLHGVPTSGANLILVLAGAMIGLALGTGCGLATTVRRVDGTPIAKAGLLAATLWVAGIGARLAFSFYATHGGAESIGRFSVAHHITSSQAWTACLVLMALVEVMSRTAIIAAKYWRLSTEPAAGTSAIGPLTGAPRSVLVES